MSPLLRIRNVTITVLISILTTLFTNIIGVYAMLYNEMEPSMAKFLSTINILLFVLFFTNFGINLFGEEKIIRIKENRTLGKAYFFIQCFLALTMHFPLLLWVVGFLDIRN